MGEAIADVGAERIALGPGGGGGGSMASGAKPWAASCWCCWERLPRLEFVLVCIRECLVSSSDRENRLEQPRKVHACGFSPVCVRRWRVWCSNRWKALSHRLHLYGRGSSCEISATCESCPGSGPLGLSITGVAADILESKLSVCLGPVVAGESDGRQKRVGKILPSVFVAPKYCCLNIFHLIK